MPQPIHHILVIDDDTRIRDLLSQYLVDQGFFVSTAKDAADARLKLKEFIFDLLIVDIMMPGELGTELTASLRQQNITVPIVMLTAMGDAEDRIAGLECGADDYVPKPFEPRELVLRLQRILQRTKNPAGTGANIAFGEFTFSSKTNQLRKNQTLVDLTTNESNLLNLLCAQANTLVSREHLAQACGVNERSVDVQINRLRNKIEADPKKPQFLKTVRGEGYVLYTEQ